MGEWSGHLLQRLARQASVTGDPELERLHEELSDYPGVSTAPPHDEISAAEIVLPLRLREGDHELAFFGTISTFGTAVDITVAELSIEAFYPANAATATRLLQEIGSAAARCRPDRAVSACGRRLPTQARGHVDDRRREDQDSGQRQR